MSIATGQFLRASHAASASAILPKISSFQPLAREYKFRATRLLKTRITEHDQVVAERIGGQPYGSSETQPRGLGNKFVPLRLSQHSPASTILPHNLAMGRAT
jgi:hypothetical protein